MYADFFFDHYFNFLSIKTDQKKKEKKKKRIHLINLEQSEALKRHIHTCFMIHSVAESF